MTMADRRDACLLTIVAATFLKNFPESFGSYFVAVSTSTALDLVHTV